MIVKKRLLSIVILAIIINLVAGYYLILTTENKSLSHIEYDALSHSDTSNLQEVTPSQNC